MTSVSVEKIRKFFKNSILGATISTSRLLSGFVRGKTTAVLLGAVGVGLFSQANQLSLFALTLASLSMASGIINRMSAHTHENESVQQDTIMGTAFSVQVLLCFLIAGLGILFSRSISIIVFGSVEYRLHCMFAIASVPFSALASGYLQGMFVHPSRYPSLVWATIWANFLGLALFIPLIKHYGLIGAFAGLFFNSVILFLSYVVHLKKHFSLKRLFHFEFDRAEFKILMKFASVGLTMASFSYGANLFIRTYVLRHAGAAANGLLQVPIALTSYYSPFVTDVLWVQLYPIVSRKKDCPESREELYYVLKYTLSMQTAIAVSILVALEYFVRFAYSDAFLNAAPLVPYQLVGDFFYYFLQVFSIYYLGASFFRWNICGWIIYYFIISLATSLGVKAYGVLAVPVTYAVVNAFFCLVLLLFFAAFKVFALRSVLLHGFGCFLSLALAVAIAIFHLPWSYRLVPFFFFGVYFYFVFWIPSKSRVVHET